MADEMSINGVTSDDQTKRDGDLDLGKDNKISELSQNIEVLEQEKLELIRENEGSSEKIKVLMEEIEGLKRDQAEIARKFDEMKSEIDRSEEDKKALQFVSARAVELETEVSRLQHDLVTSMSESEEASVELRETKERFESRVKDLEKEKVCLQERIDKEVEEMKKLKAENEIRIRDLEGKVSVSQTEKKEIETVKASVEEALKQSEEKFTEMEWNVKQLQNELEEVGKVLWELKEKKSVEMVNGDFVTTKRSYIEDGEKGFKGLKLQWPATVASTGTVAVAAAAVFYLSYVRRR